MKTLEAVLFVLAFMLFALPGRWVGQALAPEAVSTRSMPAPTPVATVAPD